MGILDYLPTFKVVEPNRLTGLVMGHVISQFEAGTVATKDSEGEFVENGIILGLSSDLTLENFDASVHTQPLLHFTEEIVTFLSGNKYYATPVDATNGTYPRAIGLYVGDTFTTDNYSGTLSASTIYAKVSNGVLTLQESADVDTLFAVEVSTLATGDDAGRFTYLGIRTLAIAAADVDSDIATHAALETGVHGLV